MGDDGETVAGVAQLYLGNILYALELAALSLDEQRKATDAAKDAKSSALDAKDAAKDAKDTSKDMKK